MTRRSSTRIMVEGSSDCQGRGTHVSPARYLVRFSRDSLRLRLMGFLGFLDHAIPGKAHAGLARAVWELNPVGKHDGATMFISGSHKAAFSTPQAAADINSTLWET